MSYIDLAKSRIAFQYLGDAKSVNWLSSSVPSVINDEIVAPANTIANILDIDNQVGKQLDVAARLVGIPSRPYVDASILGYFGWNGDPFSYGWGALWYPRNIRNAGVVALPDPYFRILIKSKIAKNTSDCTIDSIINAVSILTGTDNVILVDNQDMTFGLTFYEEIGVEARVMLKEFDILPRPQGVKFIGFTIVPPNGYFGYIGDPYAKQYGIAPYAEVI